MRVGWPHNSMIHECQGAMRTERSLGAGLLILNADDWGRNRETTQSILECSTRGVLSSTSAMVFMEDSERAAAIACDRGIDTGLHLNLTAPFSAPSCPPALLELQGKVASCLRRHRLAPALVHPSLTRSFEHLVSAQIEEYRRIYGAFPTRIDGHHHMHLCTDILAGRLLPPNLIVRRSFSFSRGEKGWGNRFYRRTIDLILSRRHRLTDFFFSITPLEPHRLRRFVALARKCSVEIETHPVNPEEYQFLTGGDLVQLLADVRIATGYAI